LRRPDRCAGLGSTQDALGKEIAENTNKEDCWEFYGGGREYEDFSFWLSTVRLPRARALAAAALAVPIRAPSAATLLRWRPLAAL
jgi:hypothetical protein